MLLFHSANTNSYFDQEVETAPTIL